MEGLQDVEELTVETPFGEPSSPILLGEYGGHTVAFLARHGIGHVLSPTEVNYRANIYALKQLGVERVLSISACGSLREDFAPGDVVIPDQLFDFTKNRKRTFFEGGLVAHIGVANPFCSDLSTWLAHSVEAAGARVHRGATYITIEGPRFSTRAESHTFRAWGMSIIGMTTSPEAFLAREAEMCYAVMAHVTDYDVWHVSEEPVTVDMILQTLRSNLELSPRVIRELLKRVPEERGCECEAALSYALTTHREHISPEARKKLGILVDRYLT
jgi:5'-methylthioadenosine phosphorylase